MSTSQIARRVGPKRRVRIVVDEETVICQVSADGRADTDAPWHAVVPTRPVAADALEQPHDALRLKRARTVCGRVPADEHQRTGPHAELDTWTHYGVFTLASDGGDLCSECFPGLGRVAPPTKRVWGASFHTGG